MWQVYVLISCGIVVCMMATYNIIKKKVNVFGFLLTAIGLAVVVSSISWNRVDTIKTANQEQAVLKTLVSGNQNTKYVNLLEKYSRLAEEKSDALSFCITLTAKIITQKERIDELTKANETLKGWLKLEEKQQKNL